MKKYLLLTAIAAATISYAHADWKQFDFVNDATHTFYGHYSTKDNFVLGTKAKFNIGDPQLYGNPAKSTAPASDIKQKIDLGIFNDHKFKVIAFNDRNTVPDEEITQSYDTLKFIPNPDGSFNHYEVENVTKTEKIGFSVYRFYVQDHSAIIANGIKGVNNAEQERDKFVKGIVGDKYETNLAAGNYSYSGVAFSNFGTGDFNYNIVADANGATGSGNVTLANIKIDPSHATDRLKLNIALNEQEVKTGKITDGGVTATADSSSGALAKAAWNALSASNSDNNGAKYQLQLFGDAAQEIAGTLDGLPNRIGQVALAGKQGAQVQIVRVK